MKPNRIREECPLSKETISRIVSDIITLYPEADAVYIVGTYARSDEVPDKSKGHDIDFLIHFPKTVNRTVIERRPDEKIWHKWSGVRQMRLGRVVDFLFMFGDMEPRYGQHQWRLQQKMQTPKVLVWRRKP